MIEVLSPEPSAEWDAYVDAHPQATCHHLSGWCKIASRAYGLKARLLVARERAGARARGVLPVMVVPRPFCRYVTTGMFGAYGPVLADDARARGELLDAACAFTTREEARYLHVKALGDGPTPLTFERYDVWVNAKLPLSAGADGVWKGLKSKIRAAVRQARGAHLEAHSGHAELDTFYDVLAENMHIKGAPVYGRRFMREILATFGPSVDIVTIRSGRTTIAGALTIAHRGVLYVPFASSRPAYLRLRPNNLLYWSIIERACASGLRTLDFGTSLRKSTAFAFKLGWGALEHPAPSFVWMRGADHPPLGPGSSAVKAGVRAWRMLPRRTADALGPVICRLMA